MIETDWQVNDLSPGIEIPDNSATGAEVEIEVTDAISIEGIQFSFLIKNPDMAEAYDGNIVGTTAASDIAIEVTSPAGTRSVIATSRTGLGSIGIGALGGELDDVYHPSSPILSNAFYGESAAGTWTVKVLDTNGNDYDGLFLNNRVNSVLQQVNVRVFGH